MDMRKKYISPAIKEIDVDKSIAMMFRSPIFDHGPGGEDDWLGTKTVKSSKIFDNDATLSRTRITDESNLSKSISDSSPF